MRRFIRQIADAGLGLGLALFLGLAGAAQTNFHDLTRLGGFKKIYLLPAPNAPEIDVYVILPVGEANATGPEGLAHYLEHLVASSADQAHGTGLRQRSHNAWTSPFWTVYWNRAPIGQMDDMLRYATTLFQPPSLSDAFMRSDRDIIAREFDLRIRANPSASFAKAAYRHLYGAHGYGRAVIGTPDSIARLTPAKALAFHARHYTPHNAYLVIFGPITPQQATPLLARHLADLPANPSPQPQHDQPQLHQPLPAAPKSGLQMHLPTLARDQVLILGHAPAPPNMPRRTLFYAKILLESILNSGQPGGLGKPLYYDDFVVSNISIALQLLPGGQIAFELAFSPDAEMPIAQATQRVQQVMQDLAQNGLPESTVESQRSILQINSRIAQQANARYALGVAMDSLRNLGEALDADSHHMALHRPSTADLNALLRALFTSPSIITATATKDKP